MEPAQTPGDVRGEEVNAVAVEVAAGSVVVLGGARIGVAGEDLYVSKRNTGVERVGDGGVAKRMRADVAGDLDSLRDALNHPISIATIDRIASKRAQDQVPGDALTTTSFEHSKNRNSHRHRGRLAALTYQVQDQMPAQRFAVVLDAYGSSFGGSQRIDTQKVGKSSVMNRGGLGNLEEPDQLEPVQALGPRLVAVDLGQPRVDGRIGDNETVDVCESEEPPDGMHGTAHRGRHQAALAEVTNIEFDVGTLDTDQRVKAVGLAPSELATQLRRIKGVGLAGVPG